VSREHHSEGARAKRVGSRPALRWWRPPLRARWISEPFAWQLAASAPHKNRLRRRSALARLLRQYDDAPWGVLASAAGLSNA
jgi:hypothetical protein